MEKNYHWIPPLLLGLAFLTIFLYIFAHPNRINFDAALLLQSGELLYQGKIPYVDFVPLDPPMIIYVNAIPAAIANIFSLNPILVSSLFYACFAIYCVFLTKTLFFFSDLHFRYNQIYILLLAFTLYILAGLFLGYWGVRDFLFSLALVPFLVLRFIRNEKGKISVPLAVLTGATFGIFCVFKHYFVIIFIINELFYVFKNRSFKSVFCLENYTFLGVCFLYAIHFFFVPPGIAEGYLGKLVPMLVNNYYKFDESYSNIILNLKYFWILSILIFFAALWFAFRGSHVIKEKGNISSLLPPLLVAFLAAIFMFFIQHKGWAYQLLPACAIMSLILGVLYSEIMELKWVCNAAAVSSVIAAIILVFALHSPRHHPLEETISHYSKENDAVLVISSSVTDAYPITVQMKRKPGTRYLTSYPLAFYPSHTSNTQNYRYPDWNQLSKEEREFVNELLIDINANQPSLILIKNGQGCAGCPEGMNEFKYLEHLGFMNRLSEYVRQPNINNFAVYTYMLDKSISN